MRVEPTSMIDWRNLESFIGIIGAAWPNEDGSAGQLEDLVAIGELGRCNVAVAPSVCFFAARMVESFVTRRYPHYPAFEDLRSSPRPSLDEQINHLQQAGELDSLTAACVHEVRKWGNKVRHQSVFPSNEQSAFCLSMLKISLPWMAGERAEPVRRYCELHDITALDSEIRWLLNTVTWSDKSLSYAELIKNATNLLHNPSRNGPAFPTELTNWVTQRCIECNRLDLAGELIAPFLLNGNPDEPQLRFDRDGDFRVSHFSRLVALRLNRMGDPGITVDFLTPLAQRAGYLSKDGKPIPLRSSRSHCYAETLGILAGAQKLTWVQQREPATLTHLAQLYQHALDAEPWNTYLAINAAACASWIGDKAAARKASERLLERLELSDPRMKDKRTVSLWTMVTQAEALLLTGQIEPAIERYRHAYQVYGTTHGGDLQRAYDQVCIHAQHGVLDKVAREAIARVLSIPASTDL